MRKILNTIDFWWELIKLAPRHFYYKRILGGKRCGVCKRNFVSARGTKLHWHKMHKTYIFTPADAWELYESLINER